MVRKYLQSLETFPKSIKKKTTQNDSRTPIQPVLGFVDKLVKLGKSFELHVIPDMGHRVSLNDEALARFLLYTALFLARCYKGDRG